MVEEKYSVEPTDKYWNVRKYSNTGMQHTYIDSYKYTM